MSTVKPPPPLEPVNRVEYNAAIIHFYRAELGRADHWRSRLDTTTNWAIVTTAASMSFVFGNRDNDAVVLLLVSLLVFFFLMTEARRYRHYDIWQNRLRLLETDYFAPMLMGYTPGQTWRDVMARDLQEPRFRISMIEAMGWRLRRNYMPIFAILLASWFLKLYSTPTPVTSPQQFIERASVPPIPGILIILTGIVFNGFLLWVVVSTRNLRGASGEILPRDVPDELLTSRPYPMP